MYINSQNLEKVQLDFLHINFAPRVLTNLLFCAK